MSDYLTEEQQNIINDDNELIIVIGVPGCGKIGLLTSYIIEFIIMQFRLNLISNNDNHI